MIQNVEMWNPTLKTIMMVEDFIERNSSSGELTKYQIWKRLPRKIQYQVYCVIFDYLLLSRKIAVDSVGKVGRITLNPELVRRAMKGRGIDELNREAERLAKASKLRRVRTSKMIDRKQVAILTGSD